MLPKCKKNYPRYIFWIVTIANSTIQLVISLYYWEKLAACICLPILVDREILHFSVVDSHYQRHVGYIDQSAYC